MQPLKVTIVPVTPFAQNCSIVACTATNRAAIVDPGGDVARIRAAIDQLNVTPEKILRALKARGSSAPARAR